MNFARRNFLAGLAGWLALPRLPAKIPPKPIEPWMSEWLEKWKRAARVPVLASKGATSVEPLIIILLSATENRHDLTFRYHGGSTPGEPRRVSPGLVFQAEGFPGLYLSGFCHTRQAERIFRADLIELC